MPDNTRCFVTDDVPTQISTERQRADRHRESSISTPVSIRAYKIRKPYGRSCRPAAPALRQDAHQHVAAVERRHGNHVEHGQQHVHDDEHKKQLHQRASQRRRQCRRGPRHRAPARTPPRRRRPGSGCWPAPPRRSARNRASDAAEIRMVTGTGLAQPISGTLVRIAISGNTMRADRVHVHGRVERQPAQLTRRRIAQPIRRPGVRRLVHRTAMRSGRRERSGLR